MADSVSRKLIVAEAKRRNWHVRYVGRNDYFCKIINDKGQSELFRGSRPLRSSANGFVISKYKDLTMYYVKSQGYDVPGYLALEADADPATAAAFLRRYKTVVAKPIDGQQSLGVTRGIKDETDLEIGIIHARRFSLSGRVLLQQELVGTLYRLFVINDTLVAAASRKAPEVIGDDRHSIRELITLLNQDPRRGTGTDTPLKKVTLSDAEDLLGHAGLQRVPPRGEAVKVSPIDSISAGGEATNVTDLVHPEWHRITVQLAASAQLFVCGYDIICDDIAKPPRNNFLPLLEMNSSPGLKLHHYPTGGGAAVNLAAILLDEVFTGAANHCKN